MELTSFILGVFVVIMLLMVVSTFMNYTKTMSLRKEINSLQKEIENLYRDLETKEQKLYIYSDSLNRDRVDEQEKLYRHIDSRVDKVTDKLSHQIADIYQTIDAVESNNQNKSTKVSDKKLLVD